MNEYSLLALGAGRVPRWIVPQPPDWVCSGAGRQYIPVGRRPRGAAAGPPSYTPPAPRTCMCCASRGRFVGRSKGTALCMQRGRRRVRTAGQLTADTPPP